MLCLMIGRVGYGQEVWELVTDYSNLSTNDIYVIAGNYEPNGTVWRTLRNDQVKSANYLLAGSVLTISGNRIINKINDTETWILQSTETPDVYYIRTPKGSNYLQNLGDSKSLVYSKPTGKNEVNAQWRIHYAATSEKDGVTYSVTGLYNVGSSRILAVYYGSSISWHAESPSKYEWFDKQEVVLFRKVTDVNASITSAEYATFSSPYALDFSAESGLTVYTATVNAAKMKVSLHEVTSKKIPANTAVVLHGTQGTYTGSIVETAENLVGNDLKVATSEMSGSEHSIYVLNKKNGVLGFYKLSNTGKLEAGKAYLTLNASAPMLTFTADEVTSVGHARSSVKTDSLYFTLDGRRVMYPSRGVFIHNGRKVVIK